MAAKLAEIVDDDRRSPFHYAAAAGALACAEELLERQLPLDLRDAAGQTPLMFAAAAPAAADVVPTACGERRVGRRGKTFE